MYLNCEILQGNLMRNQPLLLGGVRQEAYLGDTVIHLLLCFSSSYGRVRLTCQECSHIQSPLTLSPLPLNKGPSPAPYHTPSHALLLHHLPPTGTYRYQHKYPAYIQQCVKCTLLLFSLLLSLFRVFTSFLLYSFILSFPAPSFPLLLS